MPDAPDAAAFWENVTGGPLQHHRRAGRSAGTRRSTTTPTRTRPRRPTRRSAAGSATSTGTRWAGSCRSRRWSPRRWTRARSGRSPAPARRSSTAGWPERPLDHERTAVILGNAMAGEKHYLTALRISFPEFAPEPRAGAQLRRAAGRRARGAARRVARPDAGRDSPRSPRTRCRASSPTCIAGRIANLFDFRGPNFVTDAACASALAAISAGVDGLLAATTSTPSSPAASTATWAPRPS